MSGDGKENKYHHHSEATGALLGRSLKAVCRNRVGLE